MSKERFVKDKLSPLLVAAYPEVLGAAYEVKGKSEAVYINYSDGAIVAVDVTGDNLPELIQDVIDKVVFN